MQMCDSERQCSGGEDEVLENCDALGLVSVRDTQCVGWTVCGMDDVRDGHCEGWAG